MEQVYTIHKAERTIKRQKTVWAWEGKDGDNAESTSRNKAVKFFVRQHPRTKYEFTTPDGHKYALQQVNDEWAVTGKDKVMMRPSLTKALNTLLNGDYFMGCESLQIAIGGE